MQDFIKNSGGFTNIKVSDIEGESKTGAFVWNTAKIDKLINDYSEGTIDIRDVKNIPFINRDIKLRKPGLLFEYTKEEMAELRRCAGDVMHFANKYAQLLTDEGIIEITLRDYQEEIITAFARERFSILMASRQIGKTVTSAIFIVWYLLFHYEKNALVVADVMDTTKEIIDKIKSIIEHLPFYMKPGIIINNVMSMKFDNGSRLIGRSTTKKTGIGFNIHLLYMDEFAHINSSYLNYFYRAIYPTVTGMKNSKVIISSTPNGMNRFHEIWQMAIEKKNKYFPMRVDYWQVPGRDDAWRAETIANLGSLEDFNQEYGLQFFASDELLLDSYDLEKIYNIKNSYFSRQLDALEFEGVNYSEFMKWHPNFLKRELPDSVPDLKNSKDYFIISIDNAEGIGKDYSVAVIYKLIPLPAKYLMKHRPSIKNELDAFSLIQVGYFKINTVNIDKFSNIIRAITFRVFNHEMVRLVIELNYKGERILEKLQAHGEYWPGLIIHSKHTKTAKFVAPGIILNSAQAKAKYCEKFKHLLSIDRIIPNEYMTVNELGAFGLTKNGVYRGQLANDDLAIASINMASFFESPQYWELCDDAFDSITDKVWLKTLQEDIINYNQEIENANRKIDFSYLNSLNE
jgi:hypothetical protein